MARSLRNLAVAAVLSFVGGCASCGGDESCPSGQTSCTDGCVDLQTNVRNCGTCGLRCASGAACVGGECACPVGQKVCNGGCVDTATWQTDPSNCGACGNDCGLGACNAGTCTCNPGTTTCASTIPRCVDAANDPRNCGTTPETACGHACPLANDACVNGTCQCPAGTSECPQPSPTACVDLATDPANCKACGVACLAGQLCGANGCECPAGEAVCGSACADRSTDPANCGACGFTCGSGATCTSGSCACATERPMLCGNGATGGGTCCAGNACCSGACQTEHSNGIGVAGLDQHFYDCKPLGTYDATQAEAAARAWQPSGTPLPGILALCPNCLGWRTPQGVSPAFCGTWCYGSGEADPLRGRVVLSPSLNCVCPAAGAPNWN